MALQIAARPTGSTELVSDDLPVLHVPTFTDPNGRNKASPAKGVVLVTIDPKTGMVTGTRMLQSTGNKLLDGAALEAYLKWRFKPGSVPQVKMPIEFAGRPRPQPSKQVQKQPAILYVLLILLGFGAAVTVMRKRKTST